MRPILILSVALVLASPLASAADGTPGDPCTFFSKDEIATHLGRSDFGEGVMQTAGTGAICTFGPGRGSLNFWVGPSSPKGFAQTRDVLAEEGRKPEAVAGLGDEAYFWGDQLYLRVGNRGLTIRLKGGEAARDKMLALARVGAAKLR